METVNEVVKWLKDHVITATVAREQLTPFPKVRIISETKHDLMLAVYREHGDPVNFRVSVKRYRD